MQYRDFLQLVVVGGYRVSVLSQLSSHGRSEVNPILLLKRQSPCLTSRAIRVNIDWIRHHPTLQKALNGSKRLWWRAQDLVFIGSSSHDTDSIIKCFILLFLSMCLFCCKCFLCGEWLSREKKSRKNQNLSIDEFRLHGDFRNTFKSKQMFCSFTEESYSIHWNSVLVTDSNLKATIEEKHDVLIVAHLHCRIRCSQHQPDLQKPHSCWRDTAHTVRDISVLGL